MGMLNKKIQKTKDKQKSKEDSKEIKKQKAVLEEKMEAEDFAGALDTLAELIQLNCRDAAIMYSGAYAYFMLGDYDRAAKWVDNTLKFAPDHIDARILLARLCIMEDKTDEALAIFDFLVKNFISGMSEEQKDAISETAEYYGEDDPVKIWADYPALAKFLQLKEVEGIPLEGEPQEAETELKGVYPPPGNKQYSLFGKFHHCSRQMRLLVRFMGHGRFHRSR